MVVIGSSSFVHLQEDYTKENAGCQGVFCKKVKKFFQSTGTGGPLKVKESQTRFRPESVSF